MFIKKYAVLILASCAMFLAAAAMAPSADNSFVWDDELYIYANPSVYDLSPKGVARIFSETHYGLYKPVTILSLAVNHHFSGDKPRAYHITNIVLHAVNTALVFALILALVNNMWAAFLCAALFGAHPLHVESVAWVCERKDMLYALFFLLASLFYIKFTVTRGWRFMAASAACFAVSLCSKPMGITLPAAVFVYDYLLGRQFDRRLLLEKLPYFVIAALFAAGTMLALQSANQIGHTYPLTDRILFIFYGLKFYAAKLLFPVNLSAIYPLPIKNGTPLPAEFWLSPVTVLGTLFLLVKYFRQERVIMAGIAFYVITISPILQVLEVGPVIAADRYSYIPALGLFLPAAVYAVKGITVLLERRKALAWLAMGGVAILLVAMTAASRARCRAWRNDYTLFSDAAAKYPAAATLNRLGSTLHNLRDYDKALKVFQMSVDMSQPLSVLASNYDDVMLSYAFIAKIQHLQGNDEVAERISRHVMNLAGSGGMWNITLAEILAEKGAYGEALAVLEPVKTVPVLNVYAYSLEGDIYAAKGDTARAVRAYDIAHTFDLRHQPGKLKMAAGKPAL